MKKRPDYILQADCKAIMAGMPDRSVDIIITDPPYQLGGRISAGIGLDQMMRICKGHIILFAEPGKAFFTPSERAYWIKTPSTKNYKRHLGRFVEDILILRRGDPDVFNAGLHWDNYTGVYTDMIQSKSSHPYEKPLTLIERLILIYSRAGDLVFDPYAGSGTTILAAERHGRKGRGVEIEKQWHDLAEARLARELHRG